MAAGKKEPEEKMPEEKNTDPPGTGHSLRVSAEEQLARVPKRSAGLKGQTAEELIYELQVHQIELETQAEELRRAQLALEKSRDSYLDLYEFAPIGYLTLSDKALVTEVNLTGTTLLGVERSTLVKARFSKFVAENDIDQWHRYFVNVLNLGEKQVCTLRLKRWDGSLFPARLESNRIIGSSGAITVRAAISDISDIQQAEDALRNANKKLHLLSSITRHEVSNQLLTLNGFLEFLQRKVPDPSLEEHFIRIASASTRISSMIRFTKTYEKIGVNAPLWQDCRTLIDTAAKEAPPGKVMVKNDLPAGAEIFADPLIASVFYNLMDNAARHCGKCTTIRFSVEEQKGDKIIVCEDNGNGIPAGEKEQIFKRGFGQNTGLGLFLACEILSITGITIRETGEPGKGARFEITVPKGAWRMAGKST